MLIRAMIVLMMGIGAAQAQDTAVGAVLPVLPEAALKKLRAAPDVFMQDAAAVIYGFGANGRIDRAGIDGFIAAERARFRAREMARYLTADMNNDGDISRDEMALLADAAPAGKRGRLQRGFDLADGDANAVMTMSELRSFSQTVALAQMTDAEAETIRGMMLFDQNGDGSVAMEEVAAGVSALVDESAAKG